VKFAVPIALAKQAWVIPTLPHFCFICLNPGTATCMQQICQWITPSYMKDVEYLPIKDTNFTSAHGMKRKQVKSIADCGEQPDTDTSFVNADERSKEVGSSFTEAELSLLFQNMSVAGTKPAVLSVVSHHSDQFVPKFAGNGFQHLYNC